MYRKRKKKESRNIEALEKLFIKIGFQNFKFLLSRVKSAEFTNRKNEAYSLLEFSERKEEKSRIKEINLLMVL